MRAAAGPGGREEEEEEEEKTFVEARGEKPMKLLHPSSGVQGATSREAPAEMIRLKETL